MWLRFCVNTERPKTGKLHSILDPLSDGKDNKVKITEEKRIKRNRKKAKKTLVNSNQKVNKIIL